jgi:hypothetical protein
MRRFTRYLPILLCSIVLVGCQSTSLGSLSKADFIQNYPNAEHGRKIKFGSKKVNAQMIHQTENLSFSLEGKNAEMEKKSVGEIAHLYRSDGRVSSVELFELSNVFTVNGQNKGFTKKGSRSSPLIQLGMFFDVSDNFVMADVKMDTTISKGNDLPPDATDMFGKIFGVAFENQFSLSGKTVRIGDVDTSIGKFFTKPLRAMMEQMNKKGSKTFELDFNWFPRLEQARNGQAIFQCRKSERNCTVSFKFGPATGQGICDGRFIVSISYSALVREDLLCDGWLEAEGKRALGVMRSRRDMDVLR